MIIKVVLYDNNLQPSSSQIYNLDIYLEKLGKRVCSVLYLIENENKLEDTEKFLKKIYYEMNSLDELSNNNLFISCMANVHSVINMIKQDEPFSLIRSSVLETKNNLLKIRGE